MSQGALRFDVPFLPDPGYAEFLAARASRLASVHFGLGGPLADGRGRVGAGDAGRLVELLALLPDTSGVRRHALLNARFQRPEAYSGSALRETLRRLEELLAAGAIDGIVLTDAYLLQALSDASPAIASELEALPGVNCAVADIRDAAAWMEAVEATSFRPPSRIVAERRLNRDPEGLARLREDLGEAFPGVGIALLANEGCLPACPFRHAHDALIAHGQADSGNPDARDFARASGLGCARRFMRRPGLLLASPFIRPEDARRYEGKAGILKLCGRTRGPLVMRRIIEAYLSGRYAGSLLDIMDAQEGLSSCAEMDNAALPDDFYDIVTRCGGVCSRCASCDVMASGAFSMKSPVLPAMRDI